MKVKILDKNINGWYLGKVSLLDYIKSLSKDSFNYNIQRGIVSNPYLDAILDSVVDANQLPPISLVVEELSEEIEDNLVVLRFNILDGLQRTYRLWIYYRLAEIANCQKLFEYRKVSNILKEECEFFSQAVSSRVIRKLFDKQNRINVWNLSEIYSNFNVYLYMWTNLSSDDVVKKMLLLNAGQKRMALPHQFELMYLHIFETYNSGNNNIHLVRSKDNTITDRNRSDRQIGEYLIPSVIIGLQSLIAGKPMRLTRELLYKDNDDSSYCNRTDFYFTKDFINIFLEGLFKLDTALCSGDSVLNGWFSKDTTMSGIMGGIGQYYRSVAFDVNNPETIISVYKDSISKLASKKGAINIQEYQKAYDQILSSKFNIGLIVRKAIAQFIYSLLDDKYPQWAFIFKTITTRDDEA